MIMTLWVFQLFLNIVLGFFAFLWIVGRKRIDWLEAEVEILNQRIGSFNETRKAQDPSASVTQESSSSGSLLAISTPPQNGGNLIERRINTAPQKIARPAADAYDRADNLLSRGTPLPEVARQTGLSIAELQLLGKVTSRSH